MIDPPPEGPDPLPADRAHSRRFVKRGLTLGKFAPLHRGHQLAVETGLTEVDEMIVLIYDAPEVTTIPLAVRAGWIRNLYPEIKVIEAWGGPKEVGYTRALMRAHEQYVIETVGIQGVTHFYSSEPYGAHMSRALGAIDRRVDELRERFPVSGSQIRSDPFANRSHVHPLVYRDLITHVVLVGAPCSGKTTLAERLAREFDTQWMPEVGRDYWERHQSDRRLAPHQLVEIAERHLEQEESLLLNSNRYLFTDTNALTTATFARYYHAIVPPRLAALADAAAMRYDLVFLCDIDIPYQDTPDRSGEVCRSEFQRQVISDLNQRKIPYITLRGTLQQRVGKVCGILDRFQKYSNLLDLPEALIQ
jgi:HTH-type transcriptional regulator, transcriptional repressor of NAD biosynthesis genes